MVTVNKHHQNRHNMKLFCTRQETSNKLSGTGTVNVTEMAQNSYKDVSGYGSVNYNFFTLIFLHLGWEQVYCN